MKKWEQKIKIQILITRLKITRTVQDEEARKELIIFNVLYSSIINICK